MRAALRWALSGTVLLTVVSFWWGGDGTDTPALVQPAVEARARAVALADVARAPSREPAQVDSGAPLPSSWPGVGLQPAQRDVFAVEQPPPPPEPVAPPPAPIPVPVVQPPAAPPLNYRYLGSMTAPGGDTQVFLVRGDMVIAVVAGQPIDDGYVVQAITDEGVQLHYPPLDVRAVIPIPPRPVNAP